MQEFFQEFHFGWRYLVLTTTVYVAVYFLFALITNKTHARSEKLTLQIWAGVVDMQLLLGIILLVIYLLDDRYYDRLTGHWTTMLIAVFMVHVPAFYRRFNGEPTAQVRRIMGLVLPIITFILVAIGLAAIDRGLIG